MTAARICAITVLIGCNGTINTPVAVESRTVRGVAVQHNVTETGVVDQPRDLSNAAVAATAPDGSFEAALAGGGSKWALDMRLDGVRSLLVDNPQAPNLDTYHFGRADIRRPALDTNVTFSITGLSSWDANASLQIVSPNVGMTMSGLEDELSIHPSATAIDGQTLNWKNALAPLIDATKGDTTLVTQLVGMKAGTRPYSAIARAGTARGFSMIDGQPATLTATLAPVAQDRSLTLSWKGSQFAALTSQMGPGARPGAAATVGIAALPDAIARTNNLFATYYTGLPSLVVFPPLPATDFDQAVTYGNPFTSMGKPWSELVTVIYAGSVPIPTESGIGSLPARLVTAVPASSLSGSDALAPSISPVRTVRVNGASLDSPRTGVGVSPVITWEAPSIGTATDFVVHVHAVNASSEGVSVKTVATLYTKSPSLQIPASVISAGSSYVLTITAVSAPGTDLSARPFVASLPYASADHVTAQLTP
jgi:hypothetical protein